jgi:hypothetical protein
MQYDDELIEMRSVGGGIFQNPVLNATHRSRDAHRMILCARTKE